MKRFNSPIRWFGGKNRLDLRNWILPILESIPHTTYVEVFGGSGGLLIAKKPSVQEVYNDIDGALYDFFDVLSRKDLFEKFYRRVAVLPYSRELYKDCLVTYAEEKDRIERVTKWFIKMRNVFGGIPDTTGWSRSYKSKESWLTCLKNLPEIHSRLQNVFLENSDWRKILKDYDNWEKNETLFYLDPPYVHSTRTYGEYNFEMSDEDHVELVCALLELSEKSHVVLSGYENNLYKPLEESGWEVLKKIVPVFCSSSLVRSKREEVLWIKPYKRKRKTISFFE